ncbi:MAG: UTP--glucose-phosphate uridylyltransferase [Gaiellales bacterium]|nr:UTP--glucose-phosphate uridylyltransferase [Gaiellales bacterium]
MPDDGLDTDLARLDPGLSRQLADAGFDAERLRGWAAGLLHAGPGVNRVAGVVEPPAPGDVRDLPARASDEGRRLSALGEAALRRGELALVVLAGGMATRMGGVVKALVEALPGTTFLDARLAEREHWQRVSGAVLPMWLMTSHATDAPVREALGDRLDRDRVAVFGQQASLRLDPDGRLFRDDDGSPSMYATGHGDLLDALAAGRLLEPFVAGGGRYLWIANLDNLGASVDPLVLGWHIEQRAPLTVEVVDKLPGDHGGIPVRWNGRPVILESFRLPAGFDDDDVPVFNTNTFVADAAALAAVDPEWTWFRVEKLVDGRPAIQFERLVGELTSVLNSRFLRVPRDGPESRFLPAKDWSELEARRDQFAARLAPLLDAS